MQISRENVYLTNRTVLINTVLLRRFHEGFFKFCSKLLVSYNNFVTAGPTLVYWIFGPRSSEHIAPLASYPH